MGQLTDIDDLDESRFAHVFDMRQQYGDCYCCLVIEQLEPTQVVATATLLVEAKFVHGGASVGHVEDVVVDSKCRGKGLARVLLAGLAKAAQEAGCYKIILDCKEHNVALYEKCGYRRCECQMRLDLPKSYACPATPSAEPCRAPTIRSG